MTRAIKNFILHILRKLHPEREKTLVLLGRDKAFAVSEKSSLETLSDAEFRVFSQYGEDGIIQYLISRIKVPNKIFIEFGVENYLESNTRFLLINNNWSGMVMDACRSNINFIKKDPISWRHDIRALHALITKDNINDLIRQYTSEEDIGLLSIDIDGNDYWVLKAIDTVRPRILICEFNNIFGAEHPVTIPYDPSFQRRKAHYSDLYFGASLKAIYDLAVSKGYVLAGVNSSGINAFFIRKDIAGSLRRYTPEEIYFASKIRESRNVQGKLSFLSGGERLYEIRDMPVMYIPTQQLVTIKELYQL